MARKKQVGKSANDAGKNPANYEIPTLPGWGNRNGNVSTALAPESFAGYLSDGERGNLGGLFEVYDKMDTDLQVGGLVDQITRTLAGAALKVEIAETGTSGDKTLAAEYLEFANDVLASMNKRDLILSFARSGLRGVGIYHITYKAEKRGSKYLAIPANLTRVPGQRYRWDNEIQSKKWGQLRVTTSSDSQGIYVSDMPEDQLFVVSDAKENGRWDLNSIYRRAAGWWLIKVYAGSWWTDRVEVWGEPIRIGRYPQGTSTLVKNETLAFLRDMGRTAYALLPENVNLQLLDQQQGTGGVSSQRELIEYIDNRLAFTFLGQTDSSTSARYGSKARSETVVGVTYDLLQDHGAMVSEAFRSMLCAIIKRNYGAVERRLVPKVSLIIVNPSVAAENANKFIALGAAGIPVKADLIYEQTGTAKPANGDLVFFNGSLHLYDDGIYKPATDQSLNEGQRVDDEAADESGRGAGSGEETDRDDNSDSDS